MKNKSGFTLVELLAVIVIMGVIVGISAPVYKSYIEKTKETKCEAEKKAILDATKTYITNSIYKNIAISHGTEKTIEWLISEKYLSNEYSKYNGESVIIKKDTTNYEVDEYDVEIKNPNSFKQKCK